MLFQKFKKTETFHNPLVAYVPSIAVLCARLLLTMDGGPLGVENVIDIWKIGKFGAKLGCNLHSLPDPLKHFITDNTCNQVPSSQLSDPTAIDVTRCIYYLSPDLQQDLH